MFNTLIVRYIGNKLTDTRHFDPTAATMLGWKTVQLQESFNEMTIHFKMAVHKFR